MEASKRAASGVDDVVSESEFVRQVKVLATDIGDVGRPDADRMVRAQLRYRGALDEMTRRSSQRWDSAPVAYELGLAYAELGEFDAAIAQYERALAYNEAHVPVRALEQLGNLQIRRAQQLVRTQSATSESVAALVDGSLRNLRGALAIGKTGERLALLGSHYKKRATLSPERRDEWLAQAVRYYGAAQSIAPQPYHLLNQLQLFIVLHGHLPSRAGLDSVEAVQRIEVGITIEHTDERHDFWGRNTLGDAALTRLIAGELFTVGGDSAARSLEPTPDVVVQRYRHAFALRSSWRERRTCLDHLQDVIDLCDRSRSDLYEHLVRVRDDLTGWTRTTFGDQF